MEFNFICWVSSFRIGTEQKITAESNRTNIKNDRNVIYSGILRKASISTTNSLYEYKLSFQPSNFQ